MKSRVGGRSTKYNQRAASVKELVQWIFNANKATRLTNTTPDGWMGILSLFCSGPTVTWRSFLPFTGGFRNKYLSTLTNIPDWWQISRPAAAALVAWELNFGSICWSKLDDLLHKSINVLFPSPQGGRFCRSCCCSVVLCYVSTKLDRVCRLSI